MSAFGTEKNFGITDSLLDAVRGVVQNKEQEENQVIDQTEEELEEKLDKEDLFHTSVENGKFMTHKHGGSGNQNTMYLHDLDHKGSDGKRPMLVTFAHTDKNKAEKIAKKFGGKLFKTRFGTFRIIKEDVELDEKVDPVNPKAVKKDFDDRKDKDLDNDGDVDSSDEYLHKRRKAISKSMSKEKKTEVDTDPKLDEGKMSRKFMKALSWHKDTTGSPKDMQDAIRKMSDKELLSLRGTDKEKARAPSGSAQSAQLKMIDREIKRRGIKEEVDLDEAKKMMEAMRVISTKGKYKVVTKGDGVAHVMYGAKKVGSGDLDDGAGGWFMNVPGKKGQQFFDSPNKIADYFEKNKITG